MPRVRRAPARGPGRPPLARRTILQYIATCKDCEVLPASPRKATVHATSNGHVVVETKHYIIEVVDS